MASSPAASSLLRLRPFDVVGLLESAYDLEATADAAWLEGMLATFAPGFDSSAAMVGFTYRLTPQGMLDPLTFSGRNAPPDLLETWNQGLRLVPREFVEATFPLVNCATFSQLAQRSAESQESFGLFQQMSRPFGTSDVLGLIGCDAERSGVHLAVLFPNVVHAPTRDVGVLGRVGAHLATTFRLRRKLAAAAASSAQVEAVLTSAGKVVHAEEPAKAATARDRLKAAVRAIEKARGGLRRKDPEGAVAQWKALVSGRWTLVDSFESDGRRYVVARENRAQVATLQSLTERERQVLAHAQLGHSTKTIAYELGISDSTVRVLLHRAAAKLGARRRT